MMRINTLWCLVLTNSLLSLCAGLGLAAELDHLKIAPRWDVMWLSPRLSGNWIMLEYFNPLPSESSAEGTVILDLPAGVTCVSALAIEFEQDLAANGERTRLVLRQARLTQTRPGGQGGELYLATTLKPGLRATGRIWAEYKGNKSVVNEFEIRVIDVPVAHQPKHIATGVAIWPYNIDQWPEFHQQYASLGFNHVNLWHGDIHNTQVPSQYVRHVVEQNRAHGIITSIDASNSWDDEVIAVAPEAQALFTNGTRGGRLGPCPSYRGPGFINRIKKNAAIARSGISFILSDEELYASGGFHGACVCERCESRWRQWLPKHRPDLPYVSPREVIAEYQEMPEYWRAWLWFRASLTTERYQIYKREIEKAVAEYGANSTMKPMLGWWVGGAEDWHLENGQNDARALSEVIDMIVLQAYFRYKIPPRDFRAVVRRQGWALNGRNSQIGIDSDDYTTGHANSPGNLLAAVLESIFAGHDGYCMWAGPYMDTRQWAELAAANDFIAKYERVFLEGKESDLFRCYVPDLDSGPRKDIFVTPSDQVFASSWENDRLGLLLISDYRANRTPVWVERSTQYSGAMLLRDAFTDNTVAQLTPNQWEFSTHVQERPVQVLYWQK